MVVSLPDEEQLNPRRSSERRREWQQDYRRERRANGKDNYPTPYREDKRGSRPQRSAFWKANVVAWDGEAVTENGEHKYVLLSNSLGDRLVNMRGISTSQALKFLTDVGSKLGKDTIHVSYGFSYDVNMILKDVPKDKLQQLWDTGEIYYDYIYRIFYVWRRELRIHRLGEPHFVFSPRYNRAIPNVEAGITVWDTLGFSQASFVKAIRQWLPDLSDEDVAYIEEMKAGRSQFKSDELPAIQRYNDKENEYLVRIHQSIIAAHKEAGLTLSRHDGAGATASAALKKFKVRGYMEPESSELYMAARHAYYGGRIEAVKIGNAEHKPVYRYDINSAYPAVIAKLPCLNHGTWRYEKTPKQLHPFAVYHVRYANNHERPFYPLPYREAHGTILFPDECEGWYWTPEVELLATDIGQHYISEGWIYERTCQCEPFSWVPQLFTLRKKFKAEGSHAQYVLKLGLNALYGKFAQQVGGKNGKAPSYHQLSWAGYVTSTVRAQMYQLSARRSESVIAFATDGILTEKPLDASCGDSLGDWSEDKFTGITLAQPGVYWLRNDAGEWEVKYRGFDANSLDREAIVECWKRGTDYAGHVTRFVGLGSALSATSRWEQWRTWISEPRRLDIRPTGKRVALPHVRKNYHERLVPTSPAVNLTPEMISEPHGIRWITGQAQRDIIDGVDIHVFENELEDSWV